MIQLQFVLGAGWSSRLIAWWGSGYGGYSHVDAVLSDGRLVGARSDSVGGEPPGVQVRPSGYEKWLKRTVVTLDATPQEEAEWEAFHLAQVGNGYDKGDILSLILGKPTKTHAGHWICSWQQTIGLQKIGKFGYLPFYPQQITPNALLLAVCAIGGKPQTWMAQSAAPV